MLIEFIMIHQARTSKIWGYLHCWHHSSLQFVPISLGTDKNLENIKFIRIALLTYLLMLSKIIIRERRAEKTSSHPIKCSEPWKAFLFSGAPSLASEYERVAWGWRKEAGGTQESNWGYPAPCRPNPAQHGSLPQPRPTDLLELPHPCPCSLQPPAVFRQRKSTGELPGLPGLVLFGESSRNRPGKPTQDYVVCVSGMPRGNFWLGLSKKNPFDW